MKRSIIAIFLIVGFSVIVQAQVSTTLVMTNPDDSSDTREFNIDN